MVIKYKLKLLVTVALLLQASTVTSAVYKCPDENGVTQFTDRPCYDGFKASGRQWLDMEEVARQEKLQEEVLRKQEEEKLQADSNLSTERRKAIEQIRKRSMERFEEKDRR